MATPFSLSGNKILNVTSCVESGDYILFKVKMKTRFNTYDIICSVTELQKCVGMRVNQVYDIDNKTYLIRLQKPDEKCVLLLESGNRFHTTAFEWPKSVAPSGFSMKLRKHLNNKRLEKLTQLGIDRVVDFQFGTGEAAYHVILELYDRGNIILADCNWIILNVLRPHTEGETIRFAVKEKYPLDRAKESTGPPSEEKLLNIFNDSKPNENLKKILNPHLEYGPAIIDHVLNKSSLAGTLRLVSNSNDKGFFIERDMPKLISALKMAEEMMINATKNVSKGYIIQKKEDRPKNKDNNESDFLLTNQEFHPFLYAQHESEPYKEFISFDQAVDEFFSTLEGQKIDLKALQIEREAMKKLQNVRKDHDKRLTDLTKSQKTDRDKAELITLNQELVDSAILAIQSAIANQLPWSEINTLVKEAQMNNDPVACSIKHLKLESNHISLSLKDPFAESDNEENTGNKSKKGEKNESGLKPMIVDIDLALSAFSNARRYFDQKRTAAKKQQKTVESQTKALKSAEKKTMQTLKEVQTITTINKARKVYWFEKFYWFISSENYLVIGGRDQIQNEMLVKRYMRPTDIYVHADIPGASSIIIINPSGEPIPPKTLNEAGQMAVSYSIAWEAKVVTSAWWVYASQVSKTAPTGEYLTTGAFMIRGKKNFLPPCILALGFSFMFRLEESSISRHENERKVVITNDECVSEDSSSVQNQDEAEQEIILSDGDDDDDDSLNGKENKERLDSITEETNVKSEEGEINADEVAAENKSDDSDDEKYPDTHIKVEHDTGKIIMQSNVRTTSVSNSDVGVDNENNDENVIYLGDDKPVIIPQLTKKKGNAKSKKNPKNEPSKNSQDATEKEKQPKSDEKQNANLVKRGQRSKLKKIKEKYKDQDDEDRAVIMEMLKPDGPKKESKKTKKGSAQNKPKTVSKPLTENKPQYKGPQREKTDKNESDGEEDETETPKVATDTNILCQLTGLPVLEDELLFAVPVIAPYSSLHNYKYKVKLTPGVGKRGKAAKTAVQIFLKDRNCTPREKDLLKAVKDENLARNLPGKVKLSAPQLTKLKK